MIPAAEVHRALIWVARVFFCLLLIDSDIRHEQPVEHPLLEMSDHMRLFRGIEQPRIFDTQNTGGNGAQEARTVAEKMPDAESKEAMLRIARDYERLAQQAEQRSGLAAKRAR